MNKLEINLSSFINICESLSKANFNDCPVIYLEDLENVIGQFDDIHIFVDKQVKEIEDDN